MQNIQNMQIAMVDTLIRDTTIVTMDGERRILTNAAIAITGDRISHVGKVADILPQVQAKTTVDGRRFVVVPGLINGHIHITGEPITRGFVPDNTGWSENVWQWLVPLYNSQTVNDEVVSAKLAALEMLRTGTTTFLEAGTIHHLNPVAEALTTAGIRGRIGRWAEDRAFNPSENQAAKTVAAIDQMERTLAELPDTEGLIVAWPLLVGHMTATDELWQAALSFAQARGGKVAAHMSPVEADPEWYLENTGRRPIEHLQRIGVLGPDVCLTHAVHLDDAEVAIMAESRANITHCPMSGLKGAYGLGPVSKMPELQAAGVNIMLGTDGNNNSNTSDLMRAMYLVAALYKDARRDTGAFPAHEAFELGTVNGAKALGLERSIGSLEVGKKADIVLHDTDRPEWRPVLNVINQLIWSADGRSVHSVWVDGKRVIDNYCSTTIDEERLYAEVEKAAAGVVQRSGLENKQVWPVL
jgi:5-methylthioadenosine/S-adenosylhomocysteine deaminase